MDTTTTTELSTPVYGLGRTQYSTEGDIAIVRIGHWENGSYVAEHEARVRVRTLIRDSGTRTITPSQVASMLAREVLIEDSAGCLSVTWTWALVQRRLDTVREDLGLRTDYHVTLVSVT